MKLFTVLVVLAVAATGEAHATPHVPTDPLLRSTWTASWITAKGAAVRDPVVIHARKRFTLAKVPERFVVHVSADNRFVLHVNGKVIGRGPARGDIEHWRYETFDLSPALQPGVNVVAATVWNFGVDAPYAQISRRTGFLMQAQDDVATVCNTDKTWEAKVEPGHTVNLAGLGPIRAHYYFYAAGTPERRDGNVWDWQWDTNEGTAWPAAASIERATPRGMRDGSPHQLSPPGWELVADALPAMEETMVGVGSIVRSSGPATVAAPFPEGGSLQVPARSRAVVLLDRKEIINAYPSITLAGGKDAVVRLTYAESLFDKQGRKGNRNEIEGKDMIGLYDEFVSDGRTHTYQPLWWRSWRYLEVQIETREAPLAITNLAARATLFPLKPLATFESSDPQLQELWAMAFRTLRISAWETYMDSPYWEQLQYIGDTRITALLSYALANEDRLARQALLAFDQSRTSDGLTMSRYPTRDQQYIPPYSLFWVGMVHDFWMYRGDAEFVRALLPGTRTVIDWFLARVRPDGLPAYLPWWAHIDPAAGGARQTEEGGSAAAAGQLLMALREAAQLEAALGDAHRAGVYRTAAARTAQALQRFWDPQRGLLKDNPEAKTFSHDVNILALDQDILSGTKRERLQREVLALGQQAPGRRATPGEVAPASIYFRYYLHRALNHVGKGDAFLALLDPWRQMLGLGLTTFPEFSDPTRSDSHAWTAHPALDLLNIAAGIGPAAPGFAKVRVAPNPGALESLTAAMPHPAGTISVGLRKNANGWSTDVALPPNVPGEFVWAGRSWPLRAGATTHLVLPARK